VDLLRLCIITALVLVGFLVVNYVFNRLFGTPPSKVRPKGTFRTLLERWMRSGGF
jgi:hypothetical protein